LFSLGKRVGHGRFKHGHIENRIDRAHRLWKAESEQQYTRLGNDFIEFEIFFRELL